MFCSFESFINTLYSILKTKISIFRCNINVNVPKVLWIVFSDNLMILGSPRTILGSPRTILGSPLTILGSPLTILGSPRTILGSPLTILGSPRMILNKKLIFGPLYATQS